MLPDDWLATGNDHLVAKALEIGAGQRTWAVQQKLRSRRTPR